MAVPKYLLDARFPVIVPAPADIAIAGAGPVVFGLDATAGPVFVSFEFELERQIGREWCWAAVALGLHRRFADVVNTARIYHTQCDVVHAVLGGVCGAKGVGGECLTPDIDCDQPVSFLFKVGASGLGFIGALVPVAVPEDEGLVTHFFETVIRPAIDDDDVVVARLNRGTNQGHVVVVYGYDEVDGARVYLADPEGPSSEHKPVNFAAFLTKCEGPLNRGIRVDELYRARFRTF